MLLYLGEFWTASTICFVNCSRVSVSLIREDKRALYLPRHRLGGGKEGAR